MKPDRWGRQGRASLPTRLICTCDDVGARCLACETESETELGCEIGPDASRPMPAPVRTPEDYAFHARIVRRWSAVGLAIWLFVVALLKMCGARTLNS